SNVAGRRRLGADASVMIEGGRSAHSGRSEELRRVAAERTIDATGGVVTPAFVNGHMHISYAHAVRGLFPDDFVGRDRLREVFRLQSAMTEEEEYWTSLLAVIELTRSGTLTFVDPGSTRYLDACLQVYAHAGGGRCARIERAAGARGGHRRQRGRGNRTDWSERRHVPKHVIKGRQWAG